MNSMIKNLLRRFGYYKLSDEDRFAIGKHFGKYILEQKGKNIEFRKHVEYFGMSELEAIMCAAHPNVVNVSFTCDQPDEK